MAFVNQHGVRPFVETFVPGLFFKIDQHNIEKVSEIAANTSKKTLLTYSIAMRDRPDMTNFLKTFTSPILFIGGEHDTIIPICTLQNQVKLYPAAKLISMGEAGHMGMFEDPKESVKVLKDFVENCFRL